MQNLQSSEEAKKAQGNCCIPPECLEKDFRSVSHDTTCCPTKMETNCTSALRKSLTDSSQSHCDMFGDKPDCQKTLECDKNSYSSSEENQMCESKVEESLNNLQKQVSSQGFCLHQLVRDMASKLDRCEFEKCRRQLSQTIDVVMNIKRDQACPSTAAGCAIPLMRDVNCISCQTTTNMTIITGSVPRMPPLKYGRTGSNATNCSIRSQCQNVSNRNWICYSRGSGRKIGGSHTKISKEMEVREMRYKRMKTPVKLVPSTMIYKNRFRRNGCC